jgi:hypothetical protein
LDKRCLSCGAANGLNIPRFDVVDVVEVDDRDLILDPHGVVEFWFDVVKA